MTPLTRRQARQVDEIAIREFGFSGSVLMENAGRGCAEVLEQQGRDGPVLVLCGKGNNAGDGFVIARHLSIRGRKVRVALGAAPSQLEGDARTAFDMLVPCSVPILDLTGIHPGAMITELDRFADGAAWIVDALLGTGAAGAPRPPFDSLIDWVNAETCHKLAVDLPTGLDCDTGVPSPTTVRADHTCTFVAAKVGFQKPGAADYLGKVHVVGIGVPASVFEAAARS